MSTPDPNYPLSLFADAASSTIGRTIIFVFACIAGIAIGNWIHVGWQNPFNTNLIAITLFASFLSVYGMFFYIVLAVVFVFFVRPEASWIWLLVAFVVQAVNAWWMADAFK